MFIHTLNSRLIGSYLCSTLHNLSSIEFQTDRLSYRNRNAAELVHQNNTLSTNNDQIILTAGTSLANVKGNLNGSFYTCMTIQLGNKNLAKQAFSLGYEWMYDFSSGKENINHWVDLGYQRNFSKDPSDPSWFGLNLGYLAKRNGDLFEKDSFRLGIEKKKHKHCSSNLFPRFI